ncbi:MAG: isocitrate/isopropylmalate dehydrogenase family protein [Candidatus Micrarchaeaceae archaeon]
MRYDITFVPGDGIGPEVIGAARNCVDAEADKYGFDIDWEDMHAGETAMKKSGTVLPENTIKSIKKNRVALKGPITTPIGKGFRSVNVELRQRLDLFANLRPAKLFQGVASRYKKVDLVVVRENTEDLYFGIEFNRNAGDTGELIGFVKRKTGRVIRRDSAISLKPISHYASKRIVEFAFQYAKRNKRKKVTAVHKANIMKFTDGLFLDTARSVARRFRNIGFDDVIVDTACMQLVLYPDVYDVMVCPNLYGDIISDLCSGLVGGLGLAPSADIGERCAVFEPVHGSAPKYAGLDKMNPTASMLSAAMMLEHIGEAKAAKDMEHAVLDVIKEGRKLTYDLKPRNPVGTRAMANEVIRIIKRS